MGAVCSSCKRACLSCLTSENELVDADEVTSEVDDGHCAHLRQTWLRYTSSSVSRMPMLQWEAERLASHNLSPLACRYMVTRHALTVTADTRLHSH